MKEFKKMFQEEERLLEESHRRTVERHNEIMAAIEQAAVSKPASRKAAVECMKTDVWRVILKEINRW